VYTCTKDIKTTEADVLAIDLGKHQDFTVIMAGNTATREVVYIDRFNKIDWGFQKKRIVNAIEQFNRPHVIIDSTGVGDSVYDDLSRLNVNITPFRFTQQSKTQIIQNLSIAIENKEIFYPRNEVLLKELDAYSYEVSPMGNIRYNAPSGMHDDTVVTLALLNELVRRDVGVEILDKDDFGIY
jgi:hypothetical protein